MDRRWTEDTVNKSLQESSKKIERYHPNCERNVKLIILSRKLLRRITLPINNTCSNCEEIYFSFQRKFRKYSTFFSQSELCVCAKKGEEKGERKRKGEKRGKHSTRWHNNFSNWIRAAWRNSRNPLKRRIWNPGRNKEGEKKGEEKRSGDPFRSRILNLFCRRWG